MRSLFGVVFGIILSMTIFVSCSESESDKFSGQLLRAGYISAYPHPDERIEGGSIIFQVTKGARECELVKVSQGAETTIKSFSLDQTEGHVLCSTPHINSKDVLNIGFLLNVPLGKNGDDVDLKYESIYSCSHGAGAQQMTVGGDPKGNRDFIVFYRIKRQECDYEWDLSHEESLESLKTVTSEHPVDYIILKVASN